MLAALDQAIVTPALRRSRDLHGLVSYRGSSPHALTSTTMTLVYGSSATSTAARHDLVAIVVFVVASLLCALARKHVRLVIARAPGIARVVWQ